MVITPMLGPDVEDNFDIVDRPHHYQLIPEKNIELIDVRDRLLDKMDGVYSARAIDYWSRSFEYLARFMEKNGVEDLKKAEWYLKRLIKQVEKETTQP